MQAVVRRSVMRSSSCPSAVEAEASGFAVGLWQPLPCSLSRRARCRSCSSCEKKFVSLRGKICLPRGKSCLGLGEKFICNLNLYNCNLRLYRLRLRLHNFRLEINFWSRGVQLFPLCWVFFSSVDVRLLLLERVQDGAVAALSHAPPRLLAAVIIRAKG